MKTTHIGKLKFCAWGCWWLERTRDMSTDVLARAILLCIAIFEISMQMIVLSIIIILL